MELSLWNIGRLLSSPLIRSKVEITEIKLENGVEDCWMLKISDLRIFLAELVLDLDNPFMDFLFHIFILTNVQYASFKFQ